MARSLYDVRSPSVCRNCRNDEYDNSSSRDETSNLIEPQGPRLRGRGDYCSLQRSPRPLTTAAGGRAGAGHFYHNVTRSELTRSHSHVNPSKLNQGPSHLREFMAELVGTTLLMQLGCMSVTRVEKSASMAVIFGFIEAALIGIFNHISTTHLNPAVTITHFAIDSVGFAQLLVHIFGELIGSILGVGLMISMTPADWLESDVCTTRPHESLTGLQAFMVEFTCTSVYCLIVSSLGDRSRGRNNQRLDESVSFKYMSIILALSLACAKYTGASMNPARSLGPAVWTGIWDTHWVYWLGPIAGAVAGPIFYHNVFKTERRHQGNHHY